MQKIYKYEKATVIVVNPDVDNQETLRNATEKFLRKVLEERNNSYGNENKS